MMRGWQVGIDNIWGGVGQRKSVNLSIEYGHESDDSQPDSREGSKSNIPENPEAAAKTEVKVGIEKADTTRHEEYQRYYHEQDEHEPHLE
jgi:hypothetical protein